MSTIPLQQPSYEGEWKLPSRGHVGMYSFITAEIAIFTIFVVAYIYFIGRSTFGPTPQVLKVPIFNSVCLLSSSLTIWVCRAQVAQNAIKSFVAFWFLHLRTRSDLPLRNRHGVAQAHLRGWTYRSQNVFGTTYYSLVGLHASHVTAGLSMILLVLIFAITGRLSQQHAERVQVLALYWHFVDAVWVVVFTVVYVIGR